MRRNKIPMWRVQEAFNSAIRRRDMRCVVRDHEPCSGPLECSHFHTVGSTPALRFYPPNAWTQCHRHHWNHHNRPESAGVYGEWLRENHPGDASGMVGMRHGFIRYTDELKAEIMRLCNADRLDEL